MCSLIKSCGKDKQKAEYVYEKFLTLVFLLCLNTRDLLLLLPGKQRNYHMLASLLIARGCQETDLKGGQKGEKEKIIIPGENAMNLSCLFAQERKKKREK
jgi:hypothetical protein